MQDKSFEQRAKDALDSLQMKPAEAVWDNIEASLNKKRKRRGIFWFLLMGVLVGVGMLWKVDSVREVRGVKRVNKVNEVNKASEINSVNAVRDIKIIPVIDKVNNVELRRALSENNTTSTALINPINALDQQVITENKIALQNQLNSTSTLMNFEKIDSFDSVKNDLIDSVPTSVIDSTNIFVNDTANIKKINKEKRVWKWSVAATVGNSFLQAGLFNNNKLYDAASYASNITGSSSQVAIPFNPPTPRNAASFNFFLQAEKTFKKNTGLFGGLGYTLYRNTISVGERVDSMLINNTVRLTNATLHNYYYKNGNNRDYTNQYHFIHFSAGMYKFLQVGKTFSVRFNVGLTGSYLLASNGLHYISVSNALVKNNSLLNKWQTGVLASIEVGLGKKPWLFVGSEIRYHFTNLSKFSGTNQHIGLVGVQMRAILPKKPKQVQR